MRMPSWDSVCRARSDAGRPKMRLALHLEWCPTLGGRLNRLSQSTRENRPLSEVIRETVIVTESLVDPRDSMRFREGEESPRVRFPDESGQQGSTTKAPSRACGAA